MMSVQKAIEWLFELNQNALFAVTPINHLEAAEPRGSFHPITARQCQEARATLGWTCARLARRADVAPQTVDLFERGLQTPYPATVMVIRDALERAGIQFETHRDARQQAPTPDAIIIPLQCRRLRKALLLGDTALSRRARKIEPTVNYLTILYFESGQVTPPREQLFAIRAVLEEALIEIILRAEARARQAMASPCSAASAPSRLAPFRTADRRLRR